MHKIKDEPSIEETNEQMASWLAEVAFMAIFRDNNEIKAKQRLAMMFSGDLDRLIQTCKKLQVLAEAEYRLKKSK
jgi:hypothetical protein